MVSVFQSISKIIYGAGSISKIANEVKILDCKRVLVVTASGITEHGVHRKMQENLEAANIPVAIFSGVVLDPTPDSIEKSAEAARLFEADCIIGLGGGSSLDSAKATASTRLMGNNPRKGTAKDLLLLLQQHF